MKKMLATALICLMALTALGQRNATLNWFGYVRSGYHYTIDEDAGNTNEFDIILTCIGLLANINEYSEVFLFAFADYPAVSSISFEDSTTASKKYFGILDAEVRFKPVEGLRLGFGQFITPFADEHFKSASFTDFIDRGYVVRNSPPYRDIGAYARYHHSLVTVQASVTNGSGMNTFDNNNAKNLSGWAQVRPLEGFSLMGGLSIGKDNAPEDLAEDLRFYSGGIGYQYGGLSLMGETSFKDYKGNTKGALYASGLYDFKINHDLLHWVTPAFRFDFLDFADDNRMDRMTFGLAFGFDERSKWLSMFRVNYELVNSKEGNQPDNLSFEFQMRFD
ncbi:MAG TPA: hypothetical protein ENN07_00580 [candidate division Zixibacteria bacterium]|nr:hypothetical protein [candidate division Zixibacteria bacterium]